MAERVKNISDIKFEFHRLIEEIENEKILDHFYKLLHNIKHNRGKADIILNQRSEEEFTESDSHLLN